MVSADKKLRETDAANQETIFRLIQSIPSPRAEPFRLWLAQVGVEHVRQLGNVDHLLAKKRAQYKKAGLDDKWIDQRIANDIIRNGLTDEWEDRGATRVEYAILTNQIHEGTFGLSVAEHKNYKLLPKNANLRDHSSYLELALISLGEATAIDFHEQRDSQGFDDLSRDAAAAGALAGRTRADLERERKRPVVTSENHLPKPKAKPALPPQQQLSMFDLLAEAEEEQQD
jgi:hypothetical protein